MKFYHPSTLLEGAAEDKIKNFDVISDDYTLAWKALVDFYGNRRGLINHSVSQLFAAKSKKSDSYSELCKLFSNTFDTVGFLRSLGRSVENTEVDLLVFLTVFKFDLTTQGEWEKSLGDSTRASTLNDLQRFFRDQLSYLE